MSLNIQTNVVTPQNQIAFKCNAYERMAWTARTLTELGGPRIETKAETLLQKIMRNILYSPEEQRYIKNLNHAVMPKEKKQALLASQALTGSNIFKNIYGNLMRIFS